MKTAGRMRIRRTSLFGGMALALCLGGSARAQTTDTGGMCQGTGGSGTATWTIAGASNLSVDDITILGGSGSPFGRAECDCRSRDIMLRIQLTTPIMQALGASVSEQVWMSASTCTDPTTRTQNNVQCEQVSDSDPPGSVTKVDTTAFTTVGQFYISIPAEALVNPKPVNVPGTWNYICDPSYVPATGDVNKGPGSDNQSREVDVIVGDNQSSSGCTLPVIVNMTPPQQPTQVTVGAGDGALSVGWTIPAGSASIENYQVLCRKKSDPTTPVMSSDFLSSTLYWFSSCINGTLYRRPMPGVQQNKVVPPPAGVVPAPASTTTPDYFPIDPNFICSDRIAANGSDLSQRIDGLENGTEYEVRVVSIDYFGNSSGSDVISGIPLPTLNPLQPFCDANGGNCPTGFGCQVSRPGRKAMAGLFGVPFVGFLGLLTLLLFRARRRRAQEIRS